jgi:hypothetical protein
MRTAQSCAIDLDETVWKPDGSVLDKSDLMRGHLFDELRYVVQARYPINAKHRGGTLTKTRTEDEFDMVMPGVRSGILNPSSGRRLPRARGPAAGKSRIMDAATIEQNSQPP